MPDVTAATFGLPQKHFTKWMEDSQPPTIPSSPQAHLKPRQNPEIPILTDYRSTPDKSFWRIFPSCPLPEPDQRLTEVDVEQFDRYTNFVWPHLTDEQRQDFDTVSHSLKFGLVALYFRESLLFYFTISSTFHLLLPNLSPNFCFAQLYLHS